jgi:hypothetical protein
VVIEKRKRRWFQFSLRALLVFVLLVSIGMSWLAVRIERKRSQWLAVAAIQKLGGGVLCDRWLDDEPGQVTDVRIWRSHTVALFSNVTIVECEDTGLTDGDVTYLRALPDVVLLDLQTPRITDSGLEYFSDWPRLRILLLDGTTITDEGLAHLKVLTSLEYLTLRNTRVSAEGVEKLKRALPDCEIVY